MAYVATINKSLSQTYDAVGIYLERPEFTHDQFYVAFYRAKRRLSVCYSAFITSQDKMAPNNDVIYSVIYSVSWNSAVSSSLLE